MRQASINRIIDCIHGDIRRAKSKQRESRNFRRSGFMQYARQALVARDIALRTAEQRRETLRHHQGAMK